MLRDLAGEDTQAIRIDSRMQFEALQAFGREFTPGAVHKLEHYPGERPIFDDPPGEEGAGCEEGTRRAREDGRYLWLALAPEGTRRYVPQWRSGFYRVALEAGVPLCLAYIDYRERVVGAEHFLQLSGDATDDKAAVQRYLGHRRGRRAAQAGPIDWKT